MIGIGLGLVRQAVRNASGQAWTPAQLFANGEQGVWYEPKPEYLFQDAAGTTPVTADGDPVGLMLDLSGNGNHATQSTSAKRPIYRTDGTLHWLEGDGVDDVLLMPALGISGADNRTAVWAGGYPTIQMGGLGGIRERWSFRDLGGFIRIEISGAGYTTAFDSASTAVSTCLLDGTTLGDHRLYQNGAVENATGTNTLTTLDSNNEIGRVTDEYPPFYSYGIILIGVALEDTSRMKTENYLAKLAGIQL